LGFAYLTCVVLWWRANDIDAINYLVQFCIVKFLTLSRMF